MELFRFILFSNKNGIYNVEFTDDTMTIRNNDGECIETLIRDRNIGGISDRDILDNFIKQSV